MALEAPLRSASVGHIPSYIQRTVAMSPESPSKLPSPFESMSSKNSDSSSFRHTFPPSNGVSKSPGLSPDELVGPSPVTSNGTDFEDEAQEEVHAAEVHAAEEAATRDGTLPNQAGQVDEGLRPEHRMSITTDIPEHLRRNSQEPNSVIHAPQFLDWKSPSDSAVNGDLKPSEDGIGFENTPSPPAKSTTPSPPPAQSLLFSDILPPPTPSRPMISTNVKPVSHFDILDTPQAQKLSNFFDDDRSVQSSNLEKIDEVRESDVEDNTSSRNGSSLYRYGESTPTQNPQAVALQTALQECWTLCNTLANLSSLHRRRVFSSLGTPDAHERAWKTCWALCKELYDNREEGIEGFHVRINLELCRDFCQALFDIRRRKDEVADSVLRVSFELNNHLYSAQNVKTLPAIFKERTLEFYITLCHRLMKQRIELAEETDSLLRACWALAEMLFNLRQNCRDHSYPNEELLVSAVQACWDLCDIFREGWTQEVRPERSTPQPGTANSYSFENGSESRSSTRQSLRSVQSSSIHSTGSGSRRSLVAEVSMMPTTPLEAVTPTTILSETPLSPESESSQMPPNILVLGRHTGWSSGASNSGVSNSGASEMSSSLTRNSRRSTSTTRTGVGSEDPDLTRVKMLILRAAMDRGFNRDLADPRTGFASLQAFVSKLPTGSFGNLPANSMLLTKYKNLVISDKIFARPTALPPAGRKVSGVDVSKSILWMTHHNPKLNFLRDLFTVVFGFSMEEAPNYKDTVIISV